MRFKPGDKVRWSLPSKPWRDILPGEVLTVEKAYANGIVVFEGKDNPGWFEWAFELVASAQQTSPQVPHRHNLVTNIPGNAVGCSCGIEITYAEAVSCPQYIGQDEHDWAEQVIAWRAKANSWQESVRQPVPSQSHFDHEVVDNEVAGKAFRYCRTCKEEV